MVENLQNFQPNLLQLNTAIIFLLLPNLLLVGWGNINWLTRRHYMEKGIFVKDITANTSVSGIFAIKSAALADSRGGSYWKLELSDRSGNMGAMIWAPLSQRYSSIESGLFAAVSGQAQLWREKLQINVKNLDFIANAEELDIFDFLPASPWNAGDMENELRELARAELHYAPWRRLVFGVLDDKAIRNDFVKFPAARSIHQAYAGGLLEHSLAVAKICKSYCDQYDFLDRQVLIAAAILHDIGKIREFSGGMFNDYTTAGNLAGHIFLGLELLAPFIAESALPKKLAEHFTHLILSHHGQREFGAPVLPQTPEAFALHTADLTDARMAQCRYLFESNGQEKEAWSVWQNSLERRLYNPPRTPQSPLDNARPAHAAKTDGQWGLFGVSGMQERTDGER